MRRFLAAFRKAIGVIAWNGHGPRKRQHPRLRKGVDTNYRAVVDDAAKVEAAGIEPSDDFAATGKLPCGCVICEECRAALALQNWRPEWLEVAFDDADLQRVVESWERLPTPMRRAILALVNSPG